ncbi:hypothetical protein [Stenotrophomonas cyclobalanopsidis]|uniref:hypothetical protein n=1 Tax=Stenotrophomonas cyclobalanopsidis TaxID=2771362 RepID=UPI0028B123C4|nr:hypothetical protein [Stenotrophomonas cyclobalanopsidis]
MTRTSARRLACAALVAVLAVSGCARPPSTEMDDEILAVLNGTYGPRTVGGRTYTAQPVEANVGPHRFMFPANLYYNQIGPFAGGGVMLAVFWPDFNAAPPGDHPVRSVQDGYRQVSIELRYVGGAGAADYLAQDLSERAALTPRWGLTPYAVDRSKVARDVREVTPDWYVVRDGDGRVRTFISCDPWEYMPNGVLMEGGTLVRSSGDRVAMCRHSMVDVEDGVGVEMSYARVLLVDWQRVEAAARELMRRYEARD